MAAYQLQATGNILRVADNAFIPVDLGNVDYLDYLSWVAEGNAADPYVAPVQTTIATAAFLERFTDAEQIAVQIAASASPALALGLTKASMLGYVDLTSNVVTTWMGGLVAANAITSDRSAAILTP